MQRTAGSNTTIDEKQESIRETLVNNLQSLTSNPQQTAEKLVDEFFEAPDFLQEFDSNLADIFKESEEIPKQMLEILCNKAVPYRQEIYYRLPPAKQRAPSVHHKPIADSSRQSHRINCFKLISRLIDFIDKQTEITLPLEFYFRTTVDFVNNESASLSSEKLNFNVTDATNYFQHLASNPVPLFMACQQGLIHPIIEQDSHEKTIFHYLLASNQSTTNPEKFLQALSIFLTHITDENLFKTINLSDQNNETPFQIAMQKYTEYLQRGADSEFIDRFEEIFVDIIEKILRNNNITVNHSEAKFLLQILYRKAIDDTSTRSLKYRKKCSELASLCINRTDHQSHPEFHGKTSAHFKYLTRDPMRLFIALRAPETQLVKKRDEKGRTVLHHLLKNSATPKQFTKSLRMLAENITEEELTSILGSQDKNGETCLCRAIRKRKIAQAHILLDTGAIPTLATITQSPEPKLRNLFNNMHYRLTCHYYGEKAADAWTANKGNYSLFSDKRFLEIDDKVEAVEQSMTPKLS